MYRKILLAYDCSIFRPALVHRCAELAQRCNAQLHILGVVVTTGAMAIAEAVGPPNVWAREKADLKRAIDPVVASLQAQGMEVTAFIRRGAPAEQIAAHAHDMGADLVIVAHDHPTVMARWLQSARDARLLDRLQCSVLVMTNEQPIL